MKLSAENYSSNLILFIFVKKIKALDIPKRLGNENRKRKRTRANISYIILITGFIDQSQTTNLFTEKRAHALRFLSELEDW